MLHPSPPAGAGAESGRCFAVVLTWPEIQNAEYEVVQRICRAAKNIGALAWVVDNDGYPLWSSSGAQLPSARRLTRQDCSFVISLHFESPRFYDIPSYTALWNPTDFYVLGQGYEPNVAKLATHTDALSCRSPIADAHGANIFAGLDRHLAAPFPAFFHSVPRPYLEPQQTADSRLFYVGINWERVNGTKGRHQDLLERLDEENLIQIYGPETLLGVPVWEGFANYRGSIPFDGESLVTKINEAGICLALSSESHQISGIMSNRLFEALAAGAVVIANPHPFIREYFSDCVYVIDDQRSPEEITEQVRDLVVGIRTNTAEARERARRGQDRLREAFALEDCLANLFAAHDERMSHFARQMLGSADHGITVILDATALDGEQVAGLIANIDGQRGVSVDLLLLGDQATLESTLAPPGRVIRSIQIIPATVPLRKDKDAVHRMAASGSAFASALAAVRTDFFCTMQVDDHWFSDHLATLAHALQRTPGSWFACSGKLVDMSGEGNVSRRYLDALTFEHTEQIIHAAFARDVGRFLYRSTLIPKLPASVFALLDGLEHRCLALWAALKGPLAQTHYASYVRMLDITEHLPRPFLSELQQSRFILDTVRGDPSWINLLASLRDRPSHAAGPELDPASIELGKLYQTTRAGDGVPLLKAGFSTPENAGVWIEGRKGELVFQLEDADKPEHAEISFRALGRPANEGGVGQRCAVAINGQAAGRFALGTEPFQYQVAIPATVDLEGPVSVTFRLRHADPVIDAHGKMVDRRHLGLQLINFGVVGQTAPEKPAPRLQPDHLYTLRLGGDGLAFAAEGFSYPEQDLTWVNGRAATLAFTLEAAARGLDLVLYAEGRNSRDGHEQVCTLTLDGTVVERRTIAEGMQQIALPLPPLRSGSHLLGLELSHAEPPLAPDGSVLDPRPLGLGIGQFGLVKRSPGKRIRALLGRTARPGTQRR